jgi:DNA-3-methyladenine glycosylase II
MEKHIKNHFARVDSVLFAALVKLKGDIDRLTPKKTNKYFSDLCEAIINQQLSEKAGATIFNRFLDLLPKRKLILKSVAMIDDNTLRNAGMSWSKVRFIKDLTKSFKEKTIDFAALKMLSDEDVVRELVKLNGVGPWTAEMFLMFSLGRPDVFSHGDVGLRRAIQKLYAFKKEPTRKQVEKITAKWTPYKTYACRILWKSLEQYCTTDSCRK